MQNNLWALVFTPGALRWLSMPALLLASLPVMAGLQPISEAPLALEANIDCDFKQDNSLECVTSNRYTILMPAGREMLSRIDFDYNATDSFSLEKAELIQPGRAPEALGPANIDTRMAPNPEQGFSSNQRTSLAFPNLQVGSVVSVTVREHWHAAPLAREFQAGMSFPAKAVRFDRFDVRYRALRPILWVSEGMDEFIIETSADRKELSLRQKVAFYRNYINESGDVHERRFPRIVLGSSDSLQDNFAAYAVRYNGILAAALPVSAAQAVLAVQGQQPEQRVASLMEYIHQNYRYLGDWRASENGYVPFTLAQINARGYGDCKDLAILLVALLKAAGIKAEPALVMRGVFAPTLLLPLVTAPNHAIVRAEVGGRTVWLDPTNQVYLPGYTMRDLQDRWALIFDAQGLVRQENIAVPATALSEVVHNEEHFSKEGQSRIVSTVQLHGGLAIWFAQMEHAQGASSTLQNICDMFANVASNCTLERNKLGFVIPLSYTIKATLNDEQSLRRLHGAYVYSRPIYEQRWDSYLLYRRAGQRLAMYLGQPKTTSQIRTLKGGKIVARPRQCTVSSPWFDLSMTSTPVPGGLRFHYQEAQKVSWLNHTEINSPEFGHMLDKARACTDQLSLKVELPK